MIPVLLARALRTAGLRWKPVSGDRFMIDESEVGEEVFTVSDMTVEAHSYPSGTVLGFNGTTEWALDSVSLDDALWLPNEGQLRTLLRGAFRSLRVHEESGSTVYTVAIDFRGEAGEYRGESAEEAYGEALLHVVGAATLA
ncbi:MAG: pilus assembly protein CpaE [Naasia sp.]